MNKPHRYKSKAPLHPVNPGPTPFQHISTDLVAPLPESNGFNAILVIVDKSSKKAVFVPTNDTLTSQGFADLLIAHWIRHFGIPLTVTSDRGPQFVNKFIDAFYKACGIKGTPSTAYHPQTDGQTERVNQELEIYLRFYVNDSHTDWTDHLPLAEFAYNDKIHSTT
jgi:transposase InsO family protein